MYWRIESFSLFFLIPFLQSAMMHFMWWVHWMKPWSCEGWGTTRSISKPLSSEHTRASLNGKGYRTPGPLEKAEISIMSGLFPWMSQLIQEMACWDGHRIYNPAANVSLGWNFSQTDLIRKDWFPINSFNIFLFFFFLFILRSKQASISNKWTH